MPNRKGWRESSGQGNWSQRYWPPGHPKALTRDGRRAVNLHVFRRDVENPADPLGRAITVQGAGKTKAIATANFETKLKALREGERQRIGGVAVGGRTPYRDWFALWLAGLHGVTRSTRDTYERNGR